MYRKRSKRCEPLAYLGLGAGSCTLEAQIILKTLAQGVTEARVTQDAKAALERLKGKK
jgi:hypothetical protein